MARIVPESDLIQTSECAYVRMRSHASDRRRALVFLPLSISRIFI